MTNLDKIKAMTANELAEWIDKKGKEIFEGDILYCGEYKHYGKIINMGSISEYCKVGGDR